MDFVVVYKICAVGTKHVGRYLDILLLIKEEYAMMGGSISDDEMHELLIHSLPQSYHPISSAMQSLEHQSLDYVIREPQEEYQR